MSFTIFCQKVRKIYSVPTVHIGCHLSFPPSSHYEKSYNHLPRHLSHTITTLIIRKLEYVCLKNKNEFIPF